MKNKAGFYTTSYACEQAGGESVAYVCLRQQDLTVAEAAGIGINVCEWHHASGNRLAFFPKNEDEKKEVDELVQEVKKAVEKAKKEDLPRSKAAVWRGLVKEDRGFGKVPFKDGKYGLFKPEWGEPDGFLYYPSAEFAEVAQTFGI